MLKAIILLLLAIMQVKLIYTGDILYFLAPQMLAFFYFSTFSFLFLAAYKAMIILAETGLVKHDSCDCGCPDGHESNLGRPVMYALFCILLGLGFFVQPKLLDSSVAQKKGIIYHQIQPRERLEDDQVGDVYYQPGRIDHEWWENYAFEGDEPAEALDEEQEALKQDLGIWYDSDYYQELAENLLGMDRIVVDEIGFLDIMMVIAAYQDEFQDREIELSGFVYRDHMMDDSELAVTRTAITCCLADATFYGILVRGQGLADFATDSWIKVTGKIDQAFVFDQNMLMIRADNVQQIPVPESPYVYPYIYRQYMP